MNNDRFINNFRNSLPGANYLNTPRVKTQEERNNPTFIGERGAKMPEGYGRQQNIIGLTALGAFLSGLGMTPEAMIPFMAAANMADSESDVKFDEVVEPSEIKIIDKFNHSPSIDTSFLNLLPISLDDDKDTLRKKIEVNNVIMRNMKKQFDSFTNGKNNTKIVPRAPEFKYNNGGK